MELTKENVYVSLQGKSKEELTELYWLLKNNNEEILNDGLDVFIKCYLNLKSKYYKFHFYSNCWSLACSSVAISKKEITIQQLKEILQPMDLTIEQQLQKAEAEVKRLKEAIEEENKPKVGDWCYFYDYSNKESKVIGKLSEITTLFYTGDFNFDQCIKITNKQLIKLLENE